jgi:hypothetical protein
MGALLHEFAPEVWVAEGPPAPFHLGFAYPTRMAAIRLSDGSLFVWSPVALSAALKREVDVLGPPTCLVSPNKLHNLFLGEWKAAYPQARLYASPGLRQRRKDLAFDDDLGDAPDPRWTKDIDQVVMRGSLAMTEIVFFHHASRTALFADLIQNLPADFYPGWRGALARFGGITAPHPGAPIDWRLSFLDRGAARAAAARILAWPIERVIIAHGDPARANGAAFVRGAFAWLLGRS